MFMLYCKLYTHFTCYLKFLRLCYFLLEIFGQLKSHQAFKIATINDWVFARKSCFFNDAHMFVLLQKRLDTAETLTIGFLVLFLLVILFVKYMYRVFRAFIEPDTVFILLDFPALNNICQ